MPSLFFEASTISISFHGPFSCTFRPRAFRSIETYTMSNIFCFPFDYRGGMLEIVGSISEDRRNQPSMSGR